jgi:hypothetical protein
MGPTDTEESSQLESCTRCRPDRERGDWERAIRCGVCGGHGAVAKRDAVLCNGCGQSLYPKVHPGHEGINEQIANGLKDVQLVGGYDSDGLLDMSRYTFSLCERCIRLKVFSACVIPPKVETVGQGMLGWEPSSFEDDQKIWRYMEWKRSGGHATARLHRRCNAEVDCPEEALYSVAYSGNVSDDCLCEQHKARFENVVNSSLTAFVPSEFLRKLVEPAAATPGESLGTIEVAPGRNQMDAVKAVMFDTKVTRIVVHMEGEDASLPPLRVVVGDGRCTVEIRPEPERPPGFVEVDDDVMAARLSVHPRRRFRRVDGAAIMGWLRAMRSAAGNRCRALSIRLEEDWLEP